MGAHLRCRYDRPPFWARLERARIVQMLLVYVGACWAVFQLPEVLQGAVGLRQGVGGFTVLLLAIGLRG